MDGQLHTEDILRITLMMKIMLKKNQLGIWNGDFLEPSKWRKENRK